MMPKLMHAIYINNTNQLESIDFDRFNHIYFGSEFCEFRLPENKFMKKVIRFSNNNEVRLTFLTPPLSDIQMQKIKKLIRILPRETEIVFNDWGLLSFVKKKRYTPILGRLLVKSVRDVRLKNMHSLENFFKSTNLDADFQNFLIKNKIFRIELDNLTQGYSLKLSKQLRTSIYYPFVHCTTTRNCLIKRTFVRKSIIGNCEQYCNKATFAAYPAKYNNLKVHISGNSQFYYNYNKPKSFHKINADRIVFFPSPT